MFGPFSRVILPLGEMKAALNCICCGAIILLTIRRIEALLTPSGVTLKVSIITCLFRRVYSRLMNREEAFFFFSLLMVVNLSLFGGGGRHGSGVAFLGFFWSGEGIFALVGVVIAGCQLALGASVP